MEQRFNKIIEDAHKVRLSDEEKSQQRGQILAFIQSQPVRVAPIARHSIRSRLINYINVIKQPLFKPMPILIALAILLGGGTSFAAEKSVPGDALYPVKVGVNEQVSGLFHFSAAAKAQWDAELTQRRLEEAEKLASRGQLNAQAQANVEAKVSKLADAIDTRVELLRTQHNDKEAAEVNAHFEAILKTHASILTDIAADEHVASPSMLPHVKHLLNAHTQDNLADKLQARAEHADKIRLQIEDHMLHVQLRTKTNLDDSTIVPVSTSEQSDLRVRLGL